MPQRSATGPQVLDEVGHSYLKEYDIADFVDFELQLGDC